MLMTLRDRRRDGLSLGLLLLLALLATLGLDVLLVDTEGLVDLGLESGLLLDAVNKLSVVHLEEHTSDLAGELGLDGLDLGEDDLTEDLLLLAGVATGGSELLLDEAAAVEILGGSSASTLGEGGVAGSVGVGTATGAGLVAALAGVGRETRHTRAGHGHTLGNGAATALGTATAADGSLLNLLHGSEELGVAGLGVGSTGGELAGDAVDGGHLLGKATTSALLGVTAGELTGAAALDSGHGHAGLGESHTATTLGEDGLLAGSVEDRGLHVLLGHTGGSGGLLHAELVASLDASLELALANVLPLGKGDVEGLAVDHALVHLGDGLGGIVGVAEADEAKALALTVGLLVRLLLGLLVAILLLLGLRLLGLHLLDLLLGLLLVLVLLLLLRGTLVLVARVGSVVAHDLGGGDGAEVGKKLAELLIVNLVVKVLDVQVDALVLVGLLHASSFVRLAQFLLALVLLLGSANVQVLSAEVLAVEVLNSLGGGLVGGEVDETEAAALALLVAGERGRGDITEGGEEVAELIVSDLVGDVLDVDVGEVGLHLLKLALAVLLGDVVTDVDLLLVEKHAVNVLDGLGGSLIRLVVNESVALGVAVLVLGDLAAQDVAEGSEGVVQSLVVNGDVEVLDEDVALAGLAEGGVTLRPHDAARAALDESVVELLESLLTIGGGVVVHVRIAKRAAGNRITADTNGSDGANLGEQLEEHGLGDGGVELANVERGRGLGVGGSRAGGRASGIGIFALSARLNVGVDGGGVLRVSAVERGVAQVVGELVDSAVVGSGGHCIGVGVDTGKGYCDGKHWLDKAD
ncbi:hypothetical protein ColTof4_03266 [Colletotrichum tofieldiae]|nr:hypothetical protein ColTof3_13318 [Colletotrichum tofieldiae]GKT70842.1 hypothetical protein ColTof4_03266 [Colletotrichum tofieldiae]